MKKVIVLVGPTSSGKTSLAINLCKDLNGEIVSADSRQIYTGMDIGTGKLPTNSKCQITKNENCWNFDGINVWGYDLVYPNEYFSTYNFAEFALKQLEQIQKAGKTPFLVGGTGFYIDAVTGDMQINSTAPDETLRKELNAKSTEELLKQLHSLNSSVLTRIDTKNRVRIIRAIEIELQDKTSVGPQLPYLENIEFVFIGLTADRKILYQRADAWVDFIWENLLLEETKSLLAAGFGETKPLNGLIYKTAVSFINGNINEHHAKIAKPAAIQRIKFDIHAYIRRQQTWFKRNNKINWLDITDPNLSQKAGNLVS